MKTLVTKVWDLPRIAFPLEGRSGRVVTVRRQSSTGVGIDSHITAPDKCEVTQWVHPRGMMICAQCAWDQRSPIRTVCMGSVNPGSVPARRDSKNNKNQKNEGPSPVSRSYKTNLCYSTPAGDWLSKIKDPNGNKTNISKNCF